MEVNIKLRWTLLILLIVDIFFWPSLHLSVNLNFLICFYCKLDKKTRSHGEFICVTVIFKMKIMIEFIFI